MKNFWRAIRLTLKYRFTIIMTVACAIFLAFFWGANITAVFPLVQISFNGETVRDYWTKEMTAKSSALADYKTKKISLQEETAGLLDADGRILIPKTDPRYESVQNARRSLDKINRDEKMASDTLAQFKRFEPYVDRYAPKTPFGTVAALMVLVMAGTIIKSIFVWIHGYYSSKIGQLGVYELREVFFQKAVDFETGYYSQQGVSDTMSRFTNDMGSLSNGITLFYGKLIREPLKMIVCVIGAAWVSWQLLLVTLIFIPAVGWMISWLARKLKRTARNSMQEMVHMYARIGETFRSIRIIKVFNRERLERAKFRHTNRANFNRGLKIAKYSSLVNPLIEVMGMLVLVTMILFASWLIITGETEICGIPMISRPLSLGGLILFFGFLIGASDPARRLSDLFAQMQAGASAADRVFEIIDRENTLPVPKNPIRLHQYEHSIRFDRVSFSYDWESRRIAEAMAAVGTENVKKEETRPNRIVLNDVSLEIPFGETLAIIGPSGCGKSTLMNLIPRFSDPVSGVVSVDDIPLTDINLFDLRQQIGLITQNPVLFNATVEENIRYGTYGKSFEEVVDAAKQAYAHDFIVNELKDGYQTQVGPVGGLLSGGQMQRISIARAILKNPRILLLDEATSQIDMQSELLFHNALKDFIGNRTTVIVTHRTGALALADRIVVMETGRIADIGTAQELMKRNEYFKNLFVPSIEGINKENKKGESLPKADYFGLNRIE